jgi:DNA-binding protein HU-beta
MARDSRALSRARFSFTECCDCRWILGPSRSRRGLGDVLPTAREAKCHLHSATVTIRELRIFLRFRKTNHCNCSGSGKLSAPITANGPLIRYRERIGPMTKNELIAAVADKAQMTKTAASAAVDATFDAITSTLKKGGEVKIMGFGNFRVVKRAAREGRDPRTGAPVKIKAAKRPRFSAGKGLKDAVNR